MKPTFALLLIVALSLGCQSEAPSGSENSGEKPPAANSGSGLAPGSVDPAETSPGAGDGDGVVGDPAPLGAVEPPEEPAPPPFDPASDGRVGVLLSHLALEIDKADQLYDTKFGLAYRGVRRKVGVDSTVVTSKGMVGVLERLQETFTDFAMLPSRIIVTDDVLIVELVQRGTVKTAIAGRERTLDKELRVPSLLIAYFNADAIQMLHLYSNSLDQMIQLALIEPLEGKRTVTANPGPPVYVAGAPQHPENADRARAAIEAMYREANIEALANVVADPFRWLDNSGQGGATARSMTHADLESSITAWHAAMTTESLDIENVWSADNVVVVQWTMTGKQVGPWMGFEPSEETTWNQPWVDVFEFDDSGKIISRISYMDPASWLTDTGSMPRPE